MPLGMLSPEMKYRHAVHSWLISGVVLVLLMVIVGGITRLTQSGLSMVRWEPIIGAIPPVTPEQWEKEFLDYQSSPEFKVYNSHFTLSEFKKIYFWEYLHRLIGRLVGLVFFIPATFFWMKKVFCPKMKRHVLLIFLGGLFQGVLGWYMVKSGLVDKPHVSHYRLAAHLATATALAAYIYWVSLEWKPFHKFHSPTIKKLAVGMVILLGIQIIYGAFVAGLKAGKMFNTFPKMGRTWFPSELESAWDIHGIFALLENGIYIQLIHRYLAYVVVFGVFLIWWKIKNQFPALMSNGQTLLALVSIQFLLGVFTLLWSVPMVLGVLHQLGALMLLLSLVNLVKKT